MPGKSNYDILITKEAIKDILNKYPEIHIKNEYIALDYESIQLAYALEALRLYMEDRLLTPNFKVDLSE